MDPIAFWKIYAFIVTGVALVFLGFRVNSYKGLVSNPPLEGKVVNVLDGVKGKKVVQIRFAGTHGSSVVEKEFEYLFKRVSPGATISIWVLPERPGIFFINQPDFNSLFMQLGKPVILVWCVAMLPLAAFIKGTS